MNTRTLSTLALLSIFAGTGTAHAFKTFGTCNGNIMGKMTREGQNFFFNPDAQQFLSDFQYAKVEWNRLPNVKDMFSGAQSNVCGSACYVENDGFNDVRVQRLGSDGPWALVKRFTFPCVSPFDSTRDGHVDSADFTFNPDQPHTFGDPPVNSTNIFARGVALHELGHMLGMDHENSGMTIMNGVGAKPNGNTQGMYSGSRAIATHPDEIKFASNNYSSGAGATDIGASNFRWNSTTSKIMLANTASFLYGCPGNTIQLKWSLGNRGTTDHVSPAPQYKVFLSLDAVVDASDLLAKTSTVPSFNRTYLDFTDSLTIPSTARKGLLYNILVQVDTTNAVAEYDEGNNLLVIKPGIVIRPNSSGNCP